MSSTNVSSGCSVCNGYSGVVHCGICGYKSAKHNPRTCEICKSVGRQAVPVDARDQEISNLREMLLGCAEALETVSDRKSFPSVFARCRYASQYAEKVRRLLKVGEKK